MKELQTLFWLLVTVLALWPLLRELCRNRMGRRARRTAPGAFIELSEGMVHYQWLGVSQGPVVVCTHGLTTPSFVWRGLAERLGQMGYRVLVYDLYGRGYSDRPKGAQTTRMHARQLREVLNAFDLHSDVTLIGYSMGACITSEFAKHDGYRLRRLVLIAPAGMSWDLGKMIGWAMNWPLIGDWAFHMMYPRNAKAAISANAKTHDGTDPFFALQKAEFSYRGYLSSVLSSIRYTLREPQEKTHKNLATSGIPMAAIWGTEDTVIPLRAMGQLSQWNRNVHHATIPHAGHDLVVTHSSEVAKAISETWHGYSAPDIYL